MKRSGGPSFLRAGIVGVVVLAALAVSPPAAGAGVLEVTPVGAETLAEDVGAKAKAVKGVAKVERYLVLGEASPDRPETLVDVLNGYRNLLASGRARRTYGYVLVNGIFHSGVFTWLELYFAQRYGLGEVGIGLALLGYGVPGFVLGPVIGRLGAPLARAGRPLGLAGLAAALLIADLPIVAAALVVTRLSLDYGMTQPSLAGLVTGEK